MAERSSDPTPEQLQELGLEEGDLGAFDVDAPIEEVVGTEADVGDQEQTLGGTTALVTEEGAPPAKEKEPVQPATPREPAGKSVDRLTPHAEAERKHALTRTTQERPAEAPGDKPTADAPSAPTTTALAPWTPTADGRRLEIPGAVVESNGDVRIPKASLQLAQRFLAFRPAWMEERARLIEAYESRDPANHPTVVHGRMVVDQMVAAAKESPDALWDYCNGFLDNLPRLKAEAKAESAERENQRLRNRTDSIDRQAEQDQLEPMLETALTEELDSYLALPQLAGLAPQREKLLKRFWEARAEIFARSDKDYPEHGLVKGQPFLRRDVLERELTFAAELLRDQTATATAETQRAEAARRNAAALGKEPAPPPAAPVGGKAPAKPGTDGRPASREDWLDRMESLASS